MPLPSPSYLTSNHCNWNNVPKECLVIQTLVDDKRVLIWDQVSIKSVDDRKVIHNMIMDYANKNSIVEALALTIPATSGWIVASFNGTAVPGNLAGLVSGKRYFLDLLIDSVKYPISFVATGTETFANINTIITTAIGLAGTTNAFASGDYEITSSGVGAASSVDYVNGNLFLSYRIYYFIEEKLYYM